MTRTKDQLQAEEFMVEDPVTKERYRRDPKVQAFLDQAQAEQEAADARTRADEDQTNADLVAEGSTDVAQARWLATQFKRRVLFNHSTGRWHVFDEDSGLWLPDRDKRTHRKAVTYAERRAADIALNPRMGERRRSAALKVARAILKKDGIEKALAVLSWFEEYSTTGDQWDTDPYLLGTPNGVVDLRTGVRLPPDPSHRVSMTTGVKYADWLTPTQAIEQAPRFAGFLREVTSGDAELVEFYIRWFGYSLFGHTLATKFLILSGKLGFNGKGAMKRLMLHVMGDYALELDQGFYERKRWTPGSDAPRADLIRLKAVRAAFLSEPTGSFNTEMLKNHTGGDRITARALNSNDVQSWQASHTITILTNDIPAVSDVGLAVADRVLVADFREHFIGSDPSKPGYKDERLDEVLASEGGAVLRILVIAAAQWHAALMRGDKGLEPVPQRILTASKEYMEQNDAIGPFLSQWCVQADGAKVAPGRLYDHYREWHEWASTHGDEPGDLLAANVFGAAMGRKFVKAGKPAVWQGIGPLDAATIAELSA